MDNGIYNILKRLNARGKDKAVTSHVLQRLTGKKDREIKRAVQLERRRHFICSTTESGGGYFRPANRGEIMDFLRQQEQRIKHHAISLRLARRLKRRK